MELSNFSITTQPIHFASIYPWVEDRNAGAVCSFAGIVREITDGQRTLHLEYEAYTEMAAKIMKQIGDEVISQYLCKRVAMVHRVGKLEISDIAVVISVSSAHRDASFQGCQYAIEQLKKRVPIWKKEITESKAYWVGIGKEEG
ncbi:molybdenum cofactor biosynthesis protein MoaE [Mechercharimyces sp. CAU 1602]|uniref:molybdenum cofactor biosynthesis protein MoaE n=1 Tax=Mechercharimyces sp. CAU 1602 TaxID=2973933 RepID=UPI00216196C8|nr:molybdenum cofactor biosynthesis protein MoaE [Mechercharimyces sp. CAU 1602]MCS1350092.1 molybdenum cofactor biosynthesis protein MoaE [Mechercharimyces sp. CAU 1602]